MRAQAALVLSLLGAAEVSAQDTTNTSHVYLVTVGVGSDIAARFGHNAIWIHNDVDSSDRAYNFGTFNMHPIPRFVVRFIQGRPNYSLTVAPMQLWLDDYQANQREVMVQELNLTAAQRNEISDRLMVNARRENREYPYDYYLDNCATRVRDLLDQVLGGALSRATKGVPAEGNLRFHTQRSTTNDLSMYLGIMALMGPSTDGPLDQWGEMFLPAKIQERVRELKVTGPGGVEVPLVKSEKTMLPMSVYHVDPAPPNWALPFLGVGSLIGLLIMAARKPGAIGKIARGVARSWLVISGICGVIILYVWFFTNHVAAANNRNILLLSPLALFLVGRVRANQNLKSNKFTRFIRYAFAGSLAVGTLLALVPALGGQWNIQLAALVVPVSAAALTLMGDLKETGERREEKGERQE